MHSMQVKENLKSGRASVFISESLYVYVHVCTWRYDTEGPLTAVSYSHTVHTHSLYYILLILLYILYVLWLHVFVKCLCVYCMCSEFSQIVSWHQPGLVVPLHRPPAVFSSIQHSDQVASAHSQLIIHLTGQQTWKSQMKISFLKFCIIFLKPHKVNCFQQTFVSCPMTKCWQIITCAAYV